MVAIDDDADSVSHSDSITGTVSHSDSITGMVSHSDSITGTVSPSSAACCIVELLLAVASDDTLCWHADDGFVPRRSSTAAQ